MTRVQKTGVGDRDRHPEMVGYRPGWHGHLLVGTESINLFGVSWTVIDTTFQGERFVVNRLFLLEPLQSGLYFRIYVDEAVPILDIAGLVIKRKG